MEREEGREGKGREGEIRDDNVKILQTGSRKGCDRVKV